MKAMILAAGLGTRLGPLTSDRPKALVKIAGQTLLEITLRRLREFGIREVIVNVHHFADMVVDYLNKNNNFGMRLEISREEILLDTGGGLKKASWFFLENSAGEEMPFLVHNVDVISTIELGKMLSFHRGNLALATLAVQQRPTSRYLLFDGQDQLCGRRGGRHEPQEAVRPSVGPSPALQPLAFSGVHIISPRFLSLMEESGAFSIIAAYVRLAAQGEKILGFRADEYYWRDLGKAEDLAQAEQELERGIISL